MKDDYKEYIEKELDEAENPNIKYYSHDEFKKNARRILNREK